MNADRIAQAAAIIARNTGIQILPSYCTYQVYVDLGAMGEECECVALASYDRDGNTTDIQFRAVKFNGFDILPYLSESAQGLIADQIKEQMQ